MESIIKRLKRLRFFDVIVQSKRDEITQLRSGIARSPQYSSEPKGSPVGNSNENLNIRIINRTQEIQMEIEQMYNERDKLVDLINRLDDPVESMVLRLIYLNNYSINQVVRQTSLSRRAVFRVRKSGLNNICHSWHTMALLK